MIKTTYLRKYLHGVTQSCDTIIEFGISCKHGGVLQSQDIVKADVRFTLTAAQEELHDGDLGSGDRHNVFTVVVLLKELRQFCDHLDGVNLKIKKR